MCCNVKFVLLALSVIVHLALLINLFPVLFEKCVIGSLTLTANVIAIGREENDARTFWSTLFVVFLTACTAIAVITVAITILCVLFKNHTRAQYALYACVVASFFFEMMIFIYVYQNLNYGPKNMIDEWLDGSVRHYKKPGSGYIRIIWDYLQSTFKCCGYRSPDDWTHPTEFDVTEYGYDYVPESCCIKPYPCGAGSYGNRTSYWVGCEQKILHITVVAEIISWALGVLAISKVTAVLFANCYIIYTERTSLTLSTTRVYKIDNRRMYFRKRLNINDNLHADVIRGSMQNC